MSAGASQAASATSSESAQRYREGLALGIVVGLLSSLPAAFRSSAGIWAVLALGGAVALWAGPVLAALRSLSRPSSGLAVPLLAASWSLGALALLGTLLKASTHHRPLGAVTFAVFAAGVLVSAAVVAARLLNLRRSSGSRAAGWALIALTAGSIALALWQGRTLFTSPPEQLGGAFVDLVLLGILGALSLRLTSSRPLSTKLTRFAPAAYLVVVALTTMAWLQPGLAESLLEASPALAWPGWF